LLRTSCGKLGICAATGAGACAAAVVGAVVVVPDVVVQAATSGANIANSTKRFALPVLVRITCLIFIKQMITV
jgi:hypothetical protein